MKIEVIVTKPHKRKDETPDYYDQRKARILMAIYNALHVAMPATELTIHFKED